MKSIGNALLKELGVLCVRNRRLSRVIKGRSRWMQWRTSGSTGLRARHSFASGKSSLTGAARCTGCRGQRTEDWRREKITYAGAESERAVACLYLPKHYAPP